MKVSEIATRLEQKNEKRWYLVETGKTSGNGSFIRKFRAQKEPE